MLSLYVVSNSVTSRAVAHQLLHPWNFPGKSAGVRCHFFLQEIFPTQGLNPQLLYPELAGRFFTAESLGKPCTHTHTHTHTHTSNLGQNRNFPSGPEAKALHSQCRGARFDSWKLDPACYN